MGRNPCLDQAIQTRKFKVFIVTRNFNTESCYFIKQLLYGFRCLDGLIQTLGNVVRVK